MIQNSHQELTNDIDVQNDQSSGRSEKELYKLISWQKQRKWGGALAFNYDGTLLAAASKNDAKVWQFKNGKMSDPVFLKGDQLIRIIRFGYLSNFFISGGTSNAMLVWIQKENKWEKEQTLEQHKSRVSCFIITKDDSQIISSSEDATIKFWKRNTQDTKWECIQTLFSIYGAIYSVIINSSENFIVSSSANKIVTIWKFCSLSQINQNERVDKSQNIKWRKYQHIKNDDYGTKICFIGDDQITWQPTNTGHLYIFQLNICNQLFELKNQIILGTGNYDFHYFTSIYHEPSKLLIVRHKYKIYFLKQTDKSKFEIVQVITFSTNWNFSALSPDGNYFVSWDFKNYQYQILGKK